MSKEILTNTSRRALGKGIGALLPTRAPAPAAVPEATHNKPGAAASHTVPISSIEPNPLQPRRVFVSARLEELAQSIRANGIIQPLVVRKASPDSDKFQLVTGERRWRAARLAGLETVPVVIQQIPDDHLLEVTLIENIQREDLNPIETAVAFDRLAKELNLSADEIGRRTGKDRSTIVNTVRLLQLPHDLQQMVSEGALSAGHARCLLKLGNIDQQRDVAVRAAIHGWSVRELERFTTKMAENGTATKPAVKDEPIDPNVKAAITEMERALGTKVRIIEKARGKGRIEIEYYSAEDLDRIYEIIAGDNS